ncbi:hypothetical protein T02_14174 [Trichinella nativa]|uniref:Uncharacterized protein n=1 Tax=Trichinella nativa TaxID=6335 RepID=A0A0V1KZW6_9BILA|nr:hypothetical protein T02_14174 [Trichinella nativa]
MISNNLTIGKQAATEATTKRVALTIVTAILATEETLTAVTIVPTFLQPASSIEIAECALRLLNSEFQMKQLARNWDTTTTTIP